MKSEYSLIKEIKRLKSVRGSGTELISLYVPAGFQISEAISKLKDELSQSSNIKSKTTRTNVQSAIEKIVQYLKLFKEPPKNGLAVFAGNLSNTPGREKIELFSIEPPLPLKVNIYRCDSDFLLEPIDDMIEAKEVFALLVMDGREATIATLKGPQIRVVKRLHSMAHAKVRKGGQSAGRYERLIEESIEDYYKRIGGSINDLFAQSEFKIKGLIVGGPGPAKEGFAKSGVLNYQIKTLGVYDTGYTDEYGLSELVEKARDLLQEQEASKERIVIERFMHEISRNGLAVYGYENTRKALLANQAVQLIVNKELDLYEVKYECNNDSEAFTKLERGNHRETKHSCGGTLNIVEEKDAVEELIEIADKSSVETVFVSEESSYGKEFLMGFTGIGAILKYK